jgi:ribosome recycling factor
MVKHGETKVQELTDAYIRKVDEVIASKESDVMTV